MVGNQFYFVRTLEQRRMTSPQCYIRNFKVADIKAAIAVRVFERSLLQNINAEPGAKFAY